MILHGCGQLPASAARPSTGGSNQPNASEPTKRRRGKRGEGQAGEDKAEAPRDQDDDADEQTPKR
jgi:hypothetical protein